MRFRKSLKFMLPHHTPSPIILLVQQQHKIVLRQTSTDLASRWPIREQSVVALRPPIEIPRKDDQSSDILEELEIVSTPSVKQSLQVDPGMSFDYYYNGSVCKLHKPCINRHNVHHAIEVACQTSSIFTDHVPDCNLWTWLDSLDRLQHLQVHDGACLECFLIRHLRRSVGFPLLVSVMHTGDTEMLKALLHVYESIDNCSEYAMRWASSVTSAEKGEGK